VPMCLTHFAIVRILVTNACGASFLRDEILYVVKEYHRALRQLYCMLIAGSRLA
jgi:hypothetical protein